MSTLDKLSRAERDEIFALAASGPSQTSEEFCRIREGLNAIIVCTSLSDEEATVRVNLVPSGTRGGWRLFAPGVSLPCDTDLETHRHIAFEC